MDLGSQLGRGQSFSSTSTLWFPHCDEARRSFQPEPGPTRYAGRACVTHSFVIREIRSGNGGDRLSLRHLRELRLPHVPLLALRPTLAKTYRARTAASQAIAVATPAAELVATPSAAASANERRCTSTRTGWRGLGQARLRRATRLSEVTRCSGNASSAGKFMATLSVS